MSKLLRIPKYLYSPNFPREPNINFVSLLRLLVPNKVLLDFGRSYPSLLSSNSISSIYFCVRHLCFRNDQFGIFDFILPAACNNNSLEFGQLKLISFPHTQMSCSSAIHCESSTLGELYSV